MQSNMLLNQRSKQIFKLSKTSLNKKNVKHLDPKHTHIVPAHVSRVAKNIACYVWKYRKIA